MAVTPDTSVCGGDVTVFGATGAIGALPVAGGAELVWMPAGGVVVVVLPTGLVVVERVVTLGLELEFDDELLLFELEFEFELLLGEEVLVTPGGVLEPEVVLAGVTPGPVVEPDVVVVGELGLELVTPGPVPAPEV